MLQKIRNFFKGMRGGLPGLSYAGQQVDTATAITEMIDHARIVGCDVVVTIQVAERREQMVCHPDSDAAKDLYQTVSQSRRYWIELWKKELETDSQRRIWDKIERRLDGEGWENGNNHATGDRE